MAAAALADIHNRQPVIVAPDHHADWLDPASPAMRLLELARAPYQGPFERRRISRDVNSPRNDHPGILTPE